MKKSGFLAAILVGGIMLLPWTVFAGETVDVTFDYNYPDAPEAIISTIEYDDIVEEPDEPERDGYIFTGWYTDADCTEEVDFEYGIDEDVTYYAGWAKTDAVVTFMLGYDDEVYETESVPLNETVGRPTSPVREGYILDGWSDDTESGSLYDFSAPVTEDLVLTALWEEKDPAATYYTVTWMWNYEGAPNDGIYDITEVKENSKISSLSPYRGEDYLVASGNWYTDPDCTDKYSFTKTRVASDITLYARWYNRYTFEAEYTELEGKTGVGYSGTAGGLSMIRSDIYEADASNGYFVTYLFYNGSELEFDLWANEETDDALLYLRLSTEMVGIHLTDEMYCVEVNGEALSFDDIDIQITVEGASTGYSDTQKQPFEDYYITNKLKLNQGANKIILRVTNNEQMGTSGTMYATAPMVDAIRIYSDTDVTWDESLGFPITDNIANIH